MLDIFLLSGELSPQELLGFVNAQISRMEKAMKNSGAKLGEFHHKYLRTSSTIEIEFTDKNGETKQYKVEGREGLLSYGELKDMRYNLQLKIKNKIGI